MRYEPLRATPAVAAEGSLRLCRHHLPDLLVVDLDLPEGGGRSCCVGSARLIG